MNDFSPPPGYPVGKQELHFGIVTVLLAVGLWNSILYGGLNLGFSVFSLGLLVCNAGYLRQKGRRFGRYGTALLLLAALITMGFARSSDTVVKAVMLLAVLFAVNLSFCLAANQNRRSSGSFATVFDSPRAMFTFGFGGMGRTLRGLEDARRNAGTAGKQGGAIVLGLVIAVPVLAVMLPLLMRSDAAFEALMDLLPETDWSEPLLSLLAGLGAAWILFSRALGLHNRTREESMLQQPGRVSPITTGILLCAVGGLYLVYLFSQLAYFWGGLSGILPEGYTLAEYARRGFFEMAWLSAINLTLVLSCSALTARQEKLPGVILTACLFLIGVTLFLIGTASAKMLLYIRSYGLTRLRCLTQTVMVWMGVCAVLVGIRLVKSRFGYMKGVILTALILGCALLWLDVDTQVARYNVRAYQNGMLETVDMTHLSQLGYGAIPYLQELTEEDDPKIADRAVSILYYKDVSRPDLRSWNLSRSRAARILQADSGFTILRRGGRMLDLDLGGADLMEYRDTHGGFHGDGETFAAVKLPEEAGRGAESMMSYGEPWWHPLPVTEELHQVLWGDSPLFADDAGKPLLPQVEKGWYFFYDEQGQPYMEQSLFSRPSFNFSLAVYDAESRILYYFELDT